MKKIRLLTSVAVAAMCVALTTCEAFVSTFRPGITENVRHYWRGVPHEHYYQLFSGHTCEVIFIVGQNYHHVTNQTHIANTDNARVISIDGEPYFPLQVLLQAARTVSANSSSNDATSKYKDFGTTNGVRKFALTLANETLIFWVNTATGEARTEWGELRETYNTQQTYSGNDPVSTDEFEDFGLDPQIRDNRLYVKAKALQNWLPCHIEIVHQTGRPAPINSYASGASTPQPRLTNHYCYNSSYDSAVDSYFPSIESVYFSLTFRFPPLEEVNPIVVLDDGLKMSNINSQPRSFYTTRRALEIADNFLEFQLVTGGWPKNLDMINKHGILESQIGSGESTIDNNATHLQLHYLARIIASGSNNQRYIAAFHRGIAFLLRAQYPTGGWPQFFEPVSSTSYYAHITYNDEAMFSVMELFEQILEKEWHLAWVSNSDPELVAKIQAARNLGIECILNTQMWTSARQALGLGPESLTGWCAQHDRTTLEPMQARAYEPASIGPDATASNVRYLMGIKNPSPDIIRSIESAVTWLKETAMVGYKSERVYSQDYKAGNTRAKIYTGNPRDMIWARFYERETGLNAVYQGRDMNPRWYYEDLPESERQRYNFQNNWGMVALEEYEVWRITRGADLRYPQTEISRDPKYDPK